MVSHARAVAPARVARVARRTTSATGDRSIGLHVFVTRQAGGAARAVVDPVLGRMKELNYPAALLSVPKDEMPIWNVKSAKRPKGRGLLLHRKLGNVPAQLVRADSPHAAP